MGALSKEEVAHIEGKYAPGVRVSCDEMHAHEATRGCVTGDEQVVVICKLVETVKQLRRRIEDAIEGMIDA